jgi:hypothetical protein
MPLPAPTPEQPKMRPRSVRQDICTIVGLDAFLLALAIGCYWLAQRVNIGQGMLVLALGLLAAGIATVIGGMLIQRFLVCVLGIVAFWIVISIWQACAKDLLQWWRQGDYGEALRSLVRLAIEDLPYFAVQIAILLVAWWFGFGRKRRSSSTEKVDRKKWTGE